MSNKNKVLEVVEKEISTEPKIDILGAETGDNISRYKQRGYDEEVLSNRRAFGVCIVEV